MHTRLIFAVEPTKYLRAHTALGSRSERRPVGGLLVATLLGALTISQPAYPAVGVVGAVGATVQSASGPVMRLFPTTVLEDIRETGAVAEEMENGLQEVIHRLDLQQAVVYRQSVPGGRR